MNATPIRLLIHGANGRMGQALQRLCDEASGCSVVAAVSRKVGPRVIDGIPQFAASELPGAPEFDVAIDFSLPEGFDAILGLCVARGKPLVSGTTGLSDAQVAALDAASAHIPLAWASNFSLGVAVLHDLVERAARVLPGWDCDIVEAHHTRKLDAPSGTALRMGEVVARELGRSLDECAIYGREGHTGERKSETIGFSTIRGGDVVGDHTVLFAGIGERIEITHKSGSRMPYALGAMRAARFLGGRSDGLFDMQDVLGLR